MEKTKSLRTIKWVLPLLVAVFGVGVVFAVSGKQDAGVERKALSDIHYFTYTGPDTQESSYEDPDNWSYEGTTDPGDCPGNSIPCVVQVDLDVYTSLDLSDEQEERWVAFLEQLIGAVDNQTGASEFMDDPSNTIHLKGAQ